jgi:hypothetical protein
MRHGLCANLRSEFTRPHVVELVSMEVHRKPECLGGGGGGDGGGGGQGVVVVFRWQMVVVVVVVVVRG